SVIQATESLGGGVSGGRAAFGSSAEGTRETAHSSVNWGMRIAAITSLGCVETINPGKVESSQPQVKAGRDDFSAVGFAFWQQPAVVGVATVLQQQPHADFWTLGPQQQPDLPTVGEAFFEPAFPISSGHPTLPSVNVTSATQATPRQDNTARRI